MQSHGGNTGDGGVLVSFIIAWIISPGTTGGVMETIIGLSLSALYFLGMGISSIVEKKVVIHLIFYILRIIMIYT